MELLKYHKKLRFPVYLIFLIISLFFNLKKTQAQLSLLNNDHDTNYIASYNELLTTRFYTTVSNATTTFIDQNIGKGIEYDIPSRLTFGLGFNYSIFGLNIGFSPLLNSATNSTYVETKSFDFRINIYSRKFLFDIYLMSHEGFYLGNPEDIFSEWLDTNGDPIRPDMQLFNSGVVVQYLFNNKKFSMRAVFMQNEWQKRSAGSFILGGDFFYSHLSGDSSFIPQDIYPPNFFNGYSLDRSSAINLGINGGYAHTFVIKKHIFLNLGLTLGPQISYAVLTSSEENQPQKSSFTLGANALLRAGIGYNSKKLYVGLLFFSDSFFHELPEMDASSLFSASRIKINFAYRFTLKKPIKWLNPNYWKFLQPKKSE